MNSPIPNQLFINGEWVDASSHKNFSCINPSNESVITEIQEGTVEDLHKAVEAAHLAFQGPWRSLSAAKRQEIVWQMGALIEKNIEELAYLESLNTGKTYFDSSKIEIPLAAEIFKYFSGFATKISGNSYQQASNLRYTLRDPVGVCGLIVPWNFPLLMAVWKLAPALAMGNTVVLKPAQETPLSVLKLAELFQTLALPKGVFNVVTGPGALLGRALVEHPLVNKIAFTGSTEVGKEVMARSAPTLKRLSLELGGKSPNIIFADADLKSALRGAMGGIFYNKGEVCAAGSRLLVERPIYEEVLNQLVEQTSKYTLGDPFEKGIRMGPVISQKQLDKVLHYIQLGQQEGARLLCGGKRASYLNQGKGFFVEPTLFADVHNRMRIAQEEIFGPVLTVIPFENEAEAIQIANDTPFGLAAGVFTRDIKKAIRTAHAILAGTIWVNTYNLYDPALPFGGYKASGFGRDLGQAALEQYTESKSIWIDLN